VEKNTLMLEQHHSSWNKLSYRTTWKE